MLSGYLLMLITATISSYLSGTRAYNDHKQATYLEIFNEGGVALNVGLLKMTAFAYSVIVVPLHGLWHQLVEHRYELTVLIALRNH